MFSPHPSSASSFLPCRWTPTVISVLGFALSTGLTEIFSRASACRPQLSHSTTTIHDLLFVDDCALNAVSEADIQRSMNLFASGCTNFELTINTDKRVVMYQPHEPNAAYAVPLIHINSTELEIVDDSAYLGSTLSSYIKINDEEVH
ncbi:hypothetical protein SprV_0200875600 [Sparganum proliferum]